MEVRDVEIVINKLKTKLNSCIIFWIEHNQIAPGVPCEYKLLTIV